MLAMTCIILTACGGQKETLTAFPSLTPEPSSTATAIATSTLTSTPTRVQPTALPSTPTITPLPAYKTKQVVFDYNVTGDHSVYDMFFEPDFFRSYSKLVLYDDGQIIIPGEIYKQKVLSPSEVKQFLSKLEALGFYSLESNQAHDPTDKLYNFGNNYQKVYDAYLYCILVNADKSRELCVYEPGISFLIPKMKHILDYLTEYEPAGMTPYYPDRILLWVQLGRNPYDDKLPTNAITWAEDLPSLETPDQKIMYVDGDMAKEIYMLFDSANAGEVFTQNGKEYTLYIDIILPHEKVTNSYQ